MQITQQVVCDWCGSPIVVVTSTKHESSHLIVCQYCLPLHGQNDFTWETRLGDKLHWHCHGRVQSLSLPLLQIDFSSSAQSVTGKRLGRIKNGHPFRALLSSVWQCFVVVRRGRPKVRGCAAGRARTESLDSSDICRHAVGLNECTTCFCIK